MTNLLAKLKKYFQSLGKQADPQTMAEKPDKSQPASNLSEENVKSLLHMLEHTHQGMYSCAETFDLLDEYVELVASDEEAALIMPYVQRHLDLCPDCREEYEILLRILQAEFPPVA